MNFINANIWSLYFGEDTNRLMLSAPITPHDIKTEKCGSLRVYVQGELDGKDGKVVFLTVHDLGTNHKSILKFINHPSMVNISSRLDQNWQLNVFRKLFYQVNANFSENSNPNIQQTLEQNFKSLWGGNLGKFEKIVKF